MLVISTTFKYNLNDQDMYKAQSSGPIQFGQTDHRFCNCHTTRQTTSKMCRRLSLGGQMLSAHALSYYVPQNKQQIKKKGKSYAIERHNKQKIIQWLIKLKLSLDLDSNFDIRSADVVPV